MYAYAGSPVVPRSAKLVKETADAALYTLTLLKVRHYDMSFVKTALYLLDSVCMYVCMRTIYFLFLIVLTDCMYECMYVSVFYGLSKKKLESLLQCMYVCMFVCM